MPLGAFKAALMGTAGVSTGDVVLIQSQTASSSATISFTSGIDSTYGEYIFKIYNLHPGTDDSDLQFQVNASGQSGYNETMTTSLFRASHKENDDTTFGYTASMDQAQGTGFQHLTTNLGNDNDQSSVVELHLFNPSNTTYVKHFYSQSTTSMYTDGTLQVYAAGYINITAAITDVQF